MDIHSKELVMKDNYAKHLIRCEICDSEKFEVILSIGRTGGTGMYGELPVKGCERCGFVMVNPRYEKQYYIDYYREAYRKITHGSSKPQSEYIENQKNRAEKIIKYLQRFKIPPGKMLDLGCAVGATMIPFLKNDWHCVGVSPEEDSVKTGREELGLDVHLGEAETMSFSEGLFDFILCLGVLAHCYDLETTMLSIRKVLKRGGLLFIRNHSGRIWGSVIEYYNNNHYRYFTKNSIELLLTRYGFEIVDFTYEPIEGMPGPLYALAKLKNDVSVEAVLNKISGGIRDSIAERKKYLKERHKDFVSRSKKIIKVAELLSFDYEKIAQEIESGKHDITIMIESSPINAVKRAVKEARGALENPIDNI